MTRKRHRIMIIGQPGSGKSTLARIVGDSLSLPVVHIDHIHWQSGWIERSAQEKMRLCSQVHGQREWVFEGGHSASWPERLHRADTLIWLDFPFSIRVWRVFWRTVRYQKQTLKEVLYNQADTDTSDWRYGVIRNSRTRPDLPEGCPEQLSWEFIRWIWNTRISSRVKMRQLFETAPMHKDKYRLTNRSEVKTFVANLNE